MGTLQNFVSSVNKYGVRTQNTFRMKISLPSLPGMDNFSARLTRSHQDIMKILDHELFCYGQGFTLPARTIEYADAFFQGYPVPVPTVMKFGTTHEMTFNDDATGTLRNIMYLWQNMTINGNVSDGNFEGNRYGYDLATLTVYLTNNEYDTKTNISTSALTPRPLAYKLHGVTVANIGETTLSNTESGIATLPVTLRSQYFELTEYVDDLTGLQSGASNGLRIR